VAALASIAVEQLFVILVGGIDLSVGSLIALTTVTGSLAFQHIGGGFVYFDRVQRKLGG
jgi:ribose/xylose/arabinose/galactoside ABC-type transport system permease subunit